MSTPGEVRAGSEQSRIVQLWQERKLEISAAAVTLGALGTVLTGVEMTPVSAAVNHSTAAATPESHGTFNPAIKIEKKLDHGYANVDIIAAKTTHFGYITVYEKGVDTRTIFVQKKTNFYDQERVPKGHHIIKVYQGKTVNEDHMLAKRSFDRK